MSVNLISVRFVSHQHVPFWHSASLREKEALVGDICNEATSVEKFHTIEIFTIGWNTGAYSRLKKLYPSKALAYVNKLHSGGWIDDETYHLMFCAVNNLLVKNSWPGYARWELYPVSFSEIGERSWDGDTSISE